jgi:cyclophilin family peptidyl-prolyl cis-trans isomerase
MGGAPYLDGDYTVFGEVIEGIEIIDKIANVETDNNDRPLQDVKMTIRILD